MWIDLVKTWIIELPILLLFLHRQDRFINILLLGMLVSAATWPFLIYYRFQYGGNVFLLEGIVAVVEGFWIRSLWKTTWPFSLLVAFTCNAVSFGLGWLGWI